MWGTLSQIWWTDLEKWQPGALHPQSSHCQRKSAVLSLMKYSLSLVTKNRIYILTLVDRDTGCFLGCMLVWVRTQHAIQIMVGFAPKAANYYSDAFDAYSRLWYHGGQYQFSQGKADTYSVEGGNTQLRHYLARLARSSSCFSRCPYALVCALGLFIYCYNGRQLYKQCALIVLLM